jgi:hypothetical protein
MKTAGLTLLVVVAPGLGFAFWPAPPAAHACGITAGGTVGITGCSLAEHEEATRRKWHLGSSYSFSSTALLFEGNQRFVQERHASLLTLEARPSRRTAVLGGVGAFLGGSLRTDTEQFDFDPGVVAVLGGGWRALDLGRSGPFLLLTGQLSYAWTRNLGAAYNAFDLRVGAIAATTLWRMLTPYLLARAFGGPVYWRLRGESIAGTDAHHYQLGAGLTLLLKRRVDLFAEAVPLGERGLVAGAGLAF